MVCEKELIASNSDYLIEKSFKRYPTYQTQEVLFDYAICMDCAMKLKGEISTSSSQKMEAYFEERYDIEERGLMLEEKDLYSVGDLYERCALKNKQQKECTEYQIIAQCAGDKMVVNLFPQMICDDAMNEIADLLSEETLGFFDDFTNKYFGIPPELESKSSRKLIFI